MPETERSLYLCFRSHKVNGNLPDELIFKLLYCFRCSSYIQFLIDKSLTRLDTGRKGSGPIGAEEEPFLASSSANSLPLKLLWPGTQLSSTWCVVPRVLRFVMVSRTRREPTLLELSALRAATESERNIMRSAGGMFSFAHVEPIKSAYNSLWYTVG